METLFGYSTIVEQGQVEWDRLNETLEGSVVW